jgi:hypothetical protein
LFVELPSNADAAAIAAAAGAAAAALSCLQVTGTLLKGYKARFKGAPISSTVDYLKQYVSVS